MPLTRRAGQTKIIIDQGAPTSTSYSEDDYHDDTQSYTDEEDEWEDDEEVAPSDSASTSNDRAPLHPQSYRHVPRRAHRVVPQIRHQYASGPGHGPQPSPSVDPDDYYGRGGGYQPHHPHQQPAHAPYVNNRGGYPQNHGGGGGHYMGGYPGGNQMIPYGNYGNNPFSPMSNSSNGASYFGNEPRHMYDMMPYQQHAYYGGGPQHYDMPPFMRQFQQLAPPAPPATEHPGQSTTPAAKEPPAPDPEKIRLEAELAAFKVAEEKAKAAEKQREIEMQIRKDAEEAFHRRMEDMRRAQEEAKREIERAKKEAERMARERIEAEKKAEEERAKIQAEQMKRAEENARMKFEAEMKAAEERRKQEELNRQRAEEAARIRLEAAIKAEAEAKAATEKKAAEEVERLKRIEADAKLKAEAEAAAKVEKDKAEAKAKAEAEEEAKKAAEALKTKIQEETKAELAKEAASSSKAQAPIKFKDAVGRKFSFPFHLCSTWQGMEDLIKQAFLQVDVLGPHVQEGHYDLIGPNGDIILPSVWEKVVQPDWNITMTMWPVEKTPPLARPAFAGGRHHSAPHIPPPPGARPGVRVPPGRRPPGVGIPPPPEWNGPVRGGLGPEITVVNAGGPRDRKSKRNSSSMLTFLTGKPTKKKSSKK